MGRRKAITDAYNEETVDRLIREAYYLRRAARDNAKAAQDAVDDLRAIMKMKNTSILTTTDGELRAENVLEQHKRFDVDGITKDYPDIAEQYKFTIEISKIIIK